MVVVEAAVVGRWCRWRRGAEAAAVMAAATMVAVVVEGISGARGSGLNNFKQTKMFETVTVDFSSTNNRHLCCHKLILAVFGLQLVLGPPLNSTITNYYLWKSMTARNV